MSLDTPMRAARAARPQTRAWKRLLVEANAQTALSEETRAQLRRHLDAADRLAAKRTAPKLPLSILQTTTADWNLRAEALAALRAAPHKYDVSPIAPWLIVQLGDLRSAIVVAAADAVAAVAAAKLFGPESAAQIFVAAAGGANVSKKVVADARRKAALAVLHARMEKIFIEAVVDVGNNAHASARRLAADAMIEMVDNAAKPADVTEFVRTLLGKTAVDKHADVRDAARRLKDVFEKRFGDEECAKILDGLPKEAIARLNNGRSKAQTNLVDGVGSSVGKDLGGPIRKAPVSNIKELIRAKREAMKKQMDSGRGKESTAPQKSSRKRSSAATRLSEQHYPAKKGTVAKLDKENAPTSMV